MNIKPLGDHIVVKIIKEEEVTSFGIVLPESAEKEKKAQGEVVAIGPGKLLDSGARAPMEVQVGDHIVFKKWGGDEVEIDKQEYKIVSQSDVLAILA